MNTGTIVLIVILILLVLLWNMKLGGRVEYGEEGVRVQIRLGLIYYTVFPRPKKEKKKKPQKAKKKKKPKKKPAAPKEEKPKESALKKVLKNTKKYAGQAEDYFSGGSGGELGVILDAIPELFAILGDTIHRLIIDELTLHYTIPGRHDAAGAAMQYGIIHSTGGAVWELLEHNFTIRDRSVGAWVDFQEEVAKVWIRVNLAYKFGDLIIIAFHVLKEGIKVLIGWRKATKQSKKAEAEEAAEAEK
ncbi:MAG: DUF2953 domain-containing protein [Oscillospiraceae bacterium]|nr:DUF2953 domain-containing protein [Oscillospiraceae bacterium]